MTPDEIFMSRCIQLARLGAGTVAPNPMVGAVLVHEGRIIGEGYHQQYGQAHAEVNCITSVAEHDLQLVRESTMYVSLEPCAHYGKTPPCADLLIRHQVPRVVVGCRDPFEAVDGKGIEKLKLAGIEVTTGVLENECKLHNKRFFTFQRHKRPWILLKWAQSQDNKIGEAGSRVLITNEASNRLVHRWRGEEAGILVGTNTALNDDPSLNTRKWPGNDPTRLVLDLQLRLPAHLQLFDRQQPTIVFNLLRHEESPNLRYFKLSEQAGVIQSLVNALYNLNIQSVLVEGGGKLLQSFINAGLWDEARVLTNTTLLIPGGVAAPNLTNASLITSEQLFSDLVQTYQQP